MIKPLDFISLLLVMLIWGINFVVVKVGVAEIPPFLLTSIRFILVGAFLVPFYPLPKGKIKEVAVLSLSLGVLHFGILFFGMKGIDAATAAIAIQSQVAFSAILATIFLKENLGWVRIVGIGLAFLGIIFLAGEPTLPDPFYLSMVLEAAFAFSFSMILVKKMGRLDPLVMNGWVCLLAAPQLFILSLIFENNQWQALNNATWLGYGALFYTVVFASIIAYSLWYSLVSRFPMSQVIPFTMLAPVIGVASGVIFLNEPLGWHKIIGGILTIIAIIAIEIWGKKNDSLS